MTQQICRTQNCGQVIGLKNLFHSMTCKSIYNLYVVCVIFSGFLVDALSVLVFFKIKVLKIEFLVSIWALKYKNPLTLLQ